MKKKMKKKVGVGIFTWLVGKFLPVGIRVGIFMWLVGKFLPGYHLRANPKRKGSEDKPLPSSLPEVTQTYKVT